MYQGRRPVEWVPRRPGSGSWTGVGMRRIIGIVIVGGLLAGCATVPNPTPPLTPRPSASPSPTVVAMSAVTFAATGLERCVVDPYGCLYRIEVTDPTGDVRYGWFDMSATPPFPRIPATMGDVPSALAPGHYVITIQKQFATDVGSFSPIPGGTPVLTNVQSVLAACTVAIDVRAGVALRIDIAFKPSTCTASVID
jgi:hypothetical protein